MNVPLLAAAGVLEILLLVQVGIIVVRLAGGERPATVTLALGSPTARRIAVLSCSVELVGVLAVGTWSLADPATFPDATVWSSYGSGYGFVPLVLPVFGLLWLRRWTGRASGKCLRSRPRRPP